MAMLPFWVLEMRARQRAEVQAAVKHNATPINEEAMAKMAFDYACSKLPVLGSGLGSGYMLAGWDVAELLRDMNIAPSDKPAWVVAIKKKFGGHMIGHGNAAGGVFSVGIPQAGEQHISPPHLPSSMEMLAMRMRWPFPRGGTAVGWSAPKFAYISAIYTETKVLVFIQPKGDEYVVIEDDKNLFPSDTLVSQIRVLEG